MKDIEKNNEAFKALYLVSRRISELEAENERIKDDNAKLRELVRDIWSDGMTLGTARKLKAENAKLREFAQAMAEVAYKGQMLCDECRFSHGCYNGGKKEHEGRGCQWWLWARELGIEVGA